MLDGEQLLKEKILFWRHGYVLVKGMFARSEMERFRVGQAVKLVFRPEDVYLSLTGALPEIHWSPEAGLTVSSRR